MKNDPRNAQGWIICPPHDYASDDCPPKQHTGRHSDPHNPPEPRYKPDPRPPLPCMNKACYACKPGPLPKKPMVANLKLRQLADCYACRVSDGAHNRRLSAEMILRLNHYCSKYDWIIFLGRCFTSDGRLTSIDFQNGILIQIIPFILATTT